jgi:hypothetical protein
MEKESFEDPQVAELLNKHFISIKVDREERPDVDSVYMSVCMALTGAGGWPLTILMTPDKKPFYAGTYLSPENMTRLITRMEYMWKHSRRELYESGDAIQQYISIEPTRANKTAGGVTLDGGTVLRAVEGYSEHFDEKHGGFGTAPKFPSPHNLLFLLEYDRLSGSPRAKEMALRTLESMYRGGIFDHIAGGFSRYSTDDKWHIPHFEKMLYDNALLAQAYLTAYELYGAEADYCRTAAQKIFSWAFAELKHSEGAFYCGQDADSDGVEGKYYLLRHDEVLRILGEDDGEVYCKHFGITKRGNARELDEIVGENENVPNLIKNTHFADAEYDLSQREFLAECNRRLYEYRRERNKLRVDTKILTSWNSLMLIALVRAYEVLGDKSYLDSAKAIEQFISEKLSFAGRLYVRWAAGEVFGNGKLDDYANFSLALIHLYRATGEQAYLNRAIVYADVMVQRFGDYDGGFFLYADDDEQLISRPKEIYDGALPSGNSTAFMVISLLREHTGESKWHELSKRQARFAATYADRHPMGCPFSLITVLRDSANKSCSDGKCG